MNTKENSGIFRISGFVLVAFGVKPPLGEFAQQMKLEAVTRGRLIWNNIIPDF